MIFYSSNDNLTMEELNRTPLTQRLYIHVPFCSRKCDYCAFYSEPSPGEELIEAYLKKIKGEFIAGSKSCSKLESIYIGGGTPSLLNPKQLATLFESIIANFAISENAEISIECNPETINSENVSLITNFANRVSLGIQSFNCEFRRTIGRTGDVKAIDRALELLSSSGMENIGCDLIYAIPGETLDDWKSELQKAIALPVKHISAYSLTFEEGTKLSEQNHPLKGELNNDIYLENEVAMWEYTGDFLQDNGFPRYEISNYSQPEYKCKHNKGIWFGDTYLGCGPSASSFDGKNRWTNPNSISHWLLGGNPEIDSITPEKRAREIFVMGLRTTQGWQSDVFRQKTGFLFENWREDFSDLINGDLLKISDNEIACTPQGLLLWNEIAMKLL